MSMLSPILILEELHIFGLTFNGAGLGVPGAAYATLIAQLIVVH